MVLLWRTHRYSGQQRARSPYGWSSRGSSRRGIRYRTGKVPVRNVRIHAARGRTGTDRDLMGLIPELARN
jgi:hypothetical protein